jgi:hypothetical protein
LSSLHHYYSSTWLDQAEALQGAATPSLARVARHARGDTSAVMRHSPNVEIAPSIRSVATTWTVQLP